MSLDSDRPGAVTVAPFARLAIMTETIADLQGKMEAAVRALDFEEAKRCRDRINLLRGGAAEADVEAADTAGLTRQKSGAMGLGTNHQRRTPPADWTPPPKPDPMTTGRSSRGPRRK